jgi:DNA-directed RNA polymerase sigma subunit (sigma70/sigma32)
LFDVVPSSGSIQIPGRPSALSIARGVLIERDFAILSGRFSRHRLTWDELAAIHKMSPTRVRQIFDRALEKVREAAVAQGLNGHA